MSKYYELSRNVDERGELCAPLGNMPFESQRVYFIFPSEDCPVRGGHRHKVTRQILFCSHGSCKVRIVKYGKQEEFTINQPHRGLILEPDDWHEMFEFSADCVLTVLASHPYDANDYISEPCV